MAAADPLVNPAEAARAYRGRMSGAGTATAIVLCALAAATPVLGQASDAASIRQAVLKLVDDGRAVVIAQDLYGSRHAGRLATVLELMADGTLQRNPNSSGLVKDSGDQPLGWRFTDKFGGVVEIPIWVASLDAPACKEAESLAHREGGRYGCAATANGIVFRYRR